MLIAYADPQEVRESGSPSLENHKAVGFLSNTGPDPQENHIATKPAFNVVTFSTR